MRMRSACSCPVMAFILLAWPGCQEPAAPTDAVCEKDLDCPSGTFCDPQEACQTCVDTRIPPDRCGDGHIVREQFGNQCERDQCVCGHLSVYVPDLGKCVPGPFPQMIACPMFTFGSPEPTAGGCVFDFGTVAEGDSSTRSVSVLCALGGPLPCEVYAASLSGALASEEFTLLDPGPRTIQPGEYVDIRITYSPKNPGVDKGRLLIETNAVFTPSTLSVIVQGATPAAPCDADGDCPIDSECVAATKTCGACMKPESPPCPGGQVVGVTNGGSCTFPACRCPEGQVYLPGGVGCQALATCSPTAPCSRGTCDPDLCCSFPECLCQDDDPDNGFCRP